MLLVFRVCVTVFVFAALRSAHTHISQGADAEAPARSAEASGGYGKDPGGAMETKPRRF